MPHKTTTIPADWHLECRALTVQRGGRTVLHDVNLTIRAGECVALIGPNGSGKTTLLLALLSLLKPTAGSVQLNDADIQRFPPQTRGRFAAYVPQTLEHLPAFRVYDVVAGGRYPYASPLRPLSHEDHEKISQALARCGLTELAERPLNTLSGGERQKTLIAAAIAQDAQTMFLDEPNTALDPAYQVELADLLRRWHESGRGLVLISHDLQLPAALGGRVIALRAGRIVADGPAPEILEPRKLGEIYGTVFETALLENGRKTVLPRWGGSQS